MPELEISWMSEEREEQEEEECRKKLELDLEPPARAKRRARVSAAQETMVDLFLLLIKKP
jgi:hypothetical protein